METLIYIGTSEIELTGGNVWFDDDKRDVHFHYTKSEAIQLRNFLNQLELEK